MYRSLYFKIILIFVVFMITVMAVVGTVLLNSVFKFYMDDFSKQIGEYLGGDTQLTETLIEAIWQPRTFGWVRCLCQRERVPFWWLDARQTPGR